MTPERRNDPHPAPPDGVEHRKCSDENCRVAREEWFLQELLPRLMIRFWIGITIAVGALGGASFFVTDASINRFELRVQRDYELSGNHDKDIMEIKESVKEINVGLSHSVEKIIDNQVAIMRKIEERR